MTAKGWQRSLVVAVACVLGAALAAQDPPDRKSGESEESGGKREVARLAIGKAGKGGLPGGAAAVAGAWSVDGARKVLLAGPEPLLDAWLEFGPEIREKGATVQASGRAPGKGRIQSRIGVGLYGKNGFQLRYVPARGEIELVRRGAVLLRRAVDGPSERPDADWHFELAVVAERNHWLVSGRVWPEGGERPGKAQLEFKIFASELQFPLAGKTVLFATPFSGEAVSFSSAVVFQDGAASPPQKVKSKR